VLRRVAMGPRLCPDGLGSAYCLTLGVLWPPPATGFGADPQTTSPRRGLVACVGDVAPITVERFLQQ
jgi:hypothetical protein